jgi:rhodanese-related sulfurtransferase
MNGRVTAGGVAAILVGYAVWLALEGRSSAGVEHDIGQIGLAEICASIEAGAPPVFVDVREPEEFAEEHLPGAIHMPIREMADRAASELPADGVMVPYCLKDFRGFEGARRLSQLGFADVRLMQKLGINGWKAAGMPTAGAIPGRTDADVVSAVVEQCRRQP